MKLIKKQAVWCICTIAIFVSTFYWFFIASDKYISQTNVVLESPQIATPTLSFSSLLSGNSAGSSDMLLLRDYLLSYDMLSKIEYNLDFREHYTQSSIDFLSRLRGVDIPREKLHEYYLKQISVELDSYAQVLRINVAAFSPKMAKEIAEYLLLEGEEKMNELGQRLAQEQVNFLERQVDKLQINFAQAKKELIDYQNKNGLISPEATMKSLAAVVAGLESNLATLKTKYTALNSFQSVQSPELLLLEAEIKAVSAQIIKEQHRMAQEQGFALNSLSASYQTLELKLQFAQDAYGGALAALENIRIEASRKLKQISILQTPTLPEYPVEPRRTYNVFVYTVLVLFFSLLIQMLILIIKDHRD